MNRTFVFSYRKCMGPVGGGTGVNYKLFLANSEYHLIENCYHVFSDIVIEPGMKNVNYEKLKPNARQNSSLRRVLSHFGLAWVCKHYNYRRRIRAYFEKLDSKYKFSENDVYIFHDIESANEFIRIFPFQNTMLVYHQQGSLYNEWKSFNSYELGLFQRYLNRYSVEAYNSVEVLGFPSFGAKESLLESETDLKKSLREREIAVLYNGFTRANDYLKNYSKDLDSIIAELQNFDGIVFCTVSALNEAKGVERIPQYLAQIKRQHSLKWVIVGNGIKAEELQSEIAKNGLSENTIWQKAPLPHDEILRIFSLTDFYIMFHRFSIFDYSTIEAMAYGNIPILTPVGGNKEVVFDNNGLFVEEFNNSDGFENFLSSIDIPSIKRRNQEIQETRFSNFAFLKRYSDLISQMREGKYEQ